MTTTSVISTVTTTSVTATVTAAAPIAMSHCNGRLGNQVNFFENFLTALIDQSIVSKYNLHCIVVYLEVTVNLQGKFITDYY